MNYMKREPIYALSTIGVITLATIMQQALNLLDKVSVEVFKIAR